jgi:dicarboxylate/amino acid:cation (Na+ or H+) symporter, DAACS family
MRSPERSHAVTKRRLSEPTKILLGLLIGATFGITLNLLFAPGAESTSQTTGYERLVWFADNVANPIGQVFLRLLFMVVVPLVFCSLLVGVASLGSLERLGRVGIRTAFWFVATTAFAVVLGLAMVNTFKPGAHIDRAKAEQIRAEFQGAAREKMELAKQGTGITISTFVNIIPRNVLKSAADERETLGVIFFALMFGIALSFVPSDRTQIFLSVLQTVYDLCVVVLGFAMKLAPFGVAGLIFSVTAKLGLDVLLALLFYLGVALTGLVLHQFLVIGALVRLAAGLSPIDFFRRCRTVMLTAFSTSSSNATLPTTIKTAVEEFGVSPKIAGFVLPLGATMNMNGTALFEGVAVLFLAQVAGIDLTLGQQAGVVLMAVLTAIGTAGVPGGSLPLLAIVLTQVGVPPDMLALIIGVDRIVDMTRTVPNVTSDLACALWIAKTTAIDEVPRPAGAALP